MRTNDCGQAVFGQTGEECRRPGGLALTRRGLALCAFAAQARIADIGCGAGASVRLLRAQGRQCVGFDLRRPVGDFPGVQARAEALPLARARLHGIVCECVLSLLQAPERILRSFWEACRPGGRLLLTDIYLKTDSPAPSGSLFSRPQLESALQNAGWRVAHFEDCEKALKAFAAQMLWHAEDSAPWARLVGGRGLSWRAVSYGLWVAQKEDA